MEVALEEAKNDIKADFRICTKKALNLKGT
jgi:hypothetical protein